MTSTFTPARPATAALPDRRGDVWQFAYWGSGFVYIRQAFTDEDRVIPIGDNATRDDWPFQIDLNYENMRPENVTREWLTDQAARWIENRDADILLGNLD